MKARLFICYIMLFHVAALAAQQQFEPRWSLKNNLLYDLTLTPNIGVEVVADSANSFQLFYGLHPWKFSDNKKLRHWSLMPEWRHWTQPEKGRLTGWFWGIHLVGGEYNAGGKKLPLGLFKTLRHNRYEGWYFGGGLTLGHAWRLGKGSTLVSPVGADASGRQKVVRVSPWRLEAAIGIGYAHSRYHQYGYEVCGEDRGTGHYNYFGPTKLALNLCYDFGKRTVMAPPPPPPPVAKVVYKPQYRLAYITPKAEAEKTRQLSGRAFIDFVVNKTDIRPDYRGNAAELAKVVQTIDVVRRDTFTTITHVSIHGYASPEGSYQNNTRLAEGRAQAFASYVQGLISLPQSIFTIESTPEDWEGLLAYLGNPGRDLGENHNAILTICHDEALSADQKEQKLKRQYPKEWRQMLEDIFPALRHSDYEVNYTIRPFTVSEAARVIREKPQHLSLNEMFLVANTYTPGSQDFNDVFETAVRMYPNDETANLNAAVIALQRNDLTAAERYLQKAGNTPEAENARGVMYAKKGDITHATEAFRRAGTTEAQHNLQEMQKAQASQQ